MVNKRLIAMQCDERGLGHLSLVFGLLAVGTLSLSVATDFWLFTTEGLDPTMMMQDGMSMSLPPLPPPPDEQEEVPPPSDAAYDYYEQLNATDEAAGVDGELDMNYPLPTEIVAAKMHSGLWRMCMYYDQGNTHEVSQNNFPLLFVHIFLLNVDRFSDLLSAHFVDSVKQNCH